MEKERKSGIKKQLLMLAGHLSVGLALLGIALPLLPTTPFLLLAMSCYIRSSEKFYHRLIHNRLFGKYIKNYQDGKGVPFRLKVLSISLLWTSILVTVFTLEAHFVLKAVLIFMAVAVSIHIMLIKPKKKSDHS